jgi:hypothetical protein
MSAWQVNRHKYGEKAFILVGMGMMLRGEVWRGAMTSDVYYGIKALEHPQARERVVHNWTSPMRRQVGTVPNTGADRRFVFLEAPDAAQVVLRFDKPVPTELIRDFRIAFAGPQARANQKETADEVQPPEAVLDPSLPPGGHRPGLDEDPAREASEARYGPGRSGLEKVTKPPKPRKKANVRKGSRSVERPRRR